MKTPDLGRLELRHNHRMLEDRNAELMTLIDRVAQQDQAALRALYDLT